MLGHGSSQAIPPAYGSSQLSGGFARGNAVGNSRNVDDSEDQRVEEHVTIQGTVNLIVTHDPPSSIDVDTSAVIGIACPVVNTMGPLLTQVAHGYSPLRSQYFSDFKLQ